MVVIGRLRGILQLQAFVADVPYVPVAAVAAVRGKGEVDAVLLAVFNLILAGLHGPYIGHTPGSDDLDVGGQGLDAQLKTNLVVSFAGGAVADGNSPFFAGNFHQALGDGGAGHGSTQEVLILIDRVGLHAGHDVIFTEIVHHIFNI